MINEIINVVYHPADHITQPITFSRYHDTPPLTRNNSTTIMPIYTQKNGIVFAIEAIRTSQKKLSQRATAKIYNIPQATLSNRINNHPHREKIYIKN